MKVHRCLLASVILWIAASCSVLPPGELAAYSDSVSEAKVAGDLILDEVAATFPRSGQEVQAACPRNAQGVRPCFRVEFALGGPQTRVGEPVDIQVRRLALSVLETYTQMLVDISAGRPAEVVAERGAQLGELNTVFSGFVATAGIATAALPIAQVTALAERVVAASSQAAGVRSVLEAEPDMRALIRLLIDDTPTLYGLYIDQFTGDRGDLVLRARRAELQGNAEEAARLRRQLEVLRSPEGNAAQARLFEEAITNYVRILDQTDKMLVALRQAITLETLGPVERTSEFLKRSTETRLLLDELIVDLQALREAN